MGVQWRRRNQWKHMVPEFVDGSVSRIPSEQSVHGTVTRVATGLPK